MNFVALDAAKLIVLMVAGGGFALAGLWLMFRPKPEGGAAKLELFGAKFEASSAGLLVFLIGAGFLGAPLIVPERPVSTSSELASEAGGVGRTPVEQPDRAAEPQSDESQRTPTSAVILPAGAGAEEQEPNDYLTEANQIQRGIFYSGSVQRDAEDWYIVATPDPDNDGIRVQVRNRDGYCIAATYNDKEELLKSGSSSHAGASFHIEDSALDSKFTLVKLSSGSSGCRYEIRAH